MKKFILLLDGMTGAGKTTTSGLLAKELPRVAIVGMDKIKKFVSDFERGVRDNLIARDVTFVMTEKYLDLGLSVIVEQPFRSVEEVEKYEKLAKSYNIPCYKYQLHAHPDIAFQRVIMRTKQNGGDLPQERVKHNISLFTPRDHIGFTVVDTTDCAIEYAANLIIKNSV